VIWTVLGVGGGMALEHRQQVVIITVMSNQLNNQGKLVDYGEIKSEPSLAGEVYFSHPLSLDPGYNIP
jgi:hypothetical protein